VPLPTCGLEELVAEAASLALLDGSVATLLRNGSNAMFQLPGGVVARVAPAGRTATAEREVQIARWLSSQGVRVTQPLGDVPQPTVVADRAITWWHTIPPHRAGTPGELGSVLRVVHALEPPDFSLPRYDPFDGIEVRLNQQTVLDPSDRDWLINHYRRLREEYEHLAPFQPPRLIHGDAWQGNLAVIDGEVPILLDFEKVAVADPAWDLVQIAVDHTDFGRVSAEEYADFVHSYGGRDIVQWPGYRCLAAVQVLRWAAFALGKANDARALPEIRHRVACIQGRVPKPWSWTAF
jgi:Ser/Thr protein kinase RdoA (MazF antagonist)